MAKKLDCQHASQKKQTDNIKCAYNNADCAFQYYCGIVGGPIMSSGRYGCVGRNQKVPPNEKP